MAAECANKTRTIYNSKFLHGVDDKRRVQIPSRWRPAAEDFEFTLIVWPKYKEGTCLRVLPPEEMAQLMDELDRMPSDNPKKTTMKRVIGGSSIQVTVDKAGRICIPEEMAKAAGIGKEVMLVGLLDRFEIWDPKRYDAMQTTDETIAAAAFQLME